MARSVLQIIQDFALKVGLESPGLVFGGTDREALELGSFANEVAEQVAEAHAWQALTKETTNIGDGVTEGFDLPPDYLRMPKDAKIWSTRWQRPLLGITDDDWLRLSVREYDLITGTWIIRGGQILFRPVLAVGETARWTYISNYVVKTDAGSFESRFMQDTDTFVLDDRLLELHMTWRWKQSEGLAYAEDMETAEIATGKAIARDGGAKIITQSPRNNAMAKVAYPWSIVP